MSWSKIFISDASAAVEQFTVSFIIDNVSICCLELRVKIVLIRYKIFNFPRAGLHSRSLRAQNRDGKNVFFLSGSRNIFL